MELNEVLDTLEGLLVSHEESSKEYEALRTAINCVKAYMLEMLCRKTAEELAQQQMDVQKIVLSEIPTDVAERIMSVFPTAKQMDVAYQEAQRANQLSLQQQAINDYKSKFRI